MAAPEIKSEDLPEALAERFLPASLHEEWIVLPKRLFSWSAVNILLLGAAIGSLLAAIAAEYVPIDQLSWGFLIFLGIAYFIRKFVIGPAEGHAEADAKFALNPPKDA